ncbi:MAG: LLM class oxidoreductase [Pseudomonadota bacterium]
MNTALDTRLPEPGFRPINVGYDRVFQPDSLSLGLVVPIESYPSGAVPSMDRHIERVQLAERLGFSAVWLRDVPFNVPSFGDAGQLLDPFVYLGALAGQTSSIALGVASIVLPLRHPAHIAKAAATADALSGGRLILGIASGDRPEEFPAMGRPFDDRGEAFRESFDYIRRMSETRPTFRNRFGAVGNGMDMLPKPVAGRLPLMITGASRQTPEWIAQHGDGWMTYPRPAMQQAALIDQFRTVIAAAQQHDKPVMEPLYIDLAEDGDAAPTPIHLGLRLGLNRLRDYLWSRHEIGVNHVALNLRFSRTPPEAVLERLAEELLPHFHQGTQR